MTTAEATGTFWNVTREEYDADDTCVRSSALKTFIEDRELYEAENVSKVLTRGESTPNQQFGTSFHAWLLEARKDWVVYTGGSKQTKEWKEFKTAHAGTTILTVDENNSLLKMADAVRANPLARELVEAGGFPESAGKWQHSSGVWCKCLWDRLLFDGTTIDIKTVGDPSDEFFGRQVRSYGYDISAAFYIQGRRAILGMADAPFKFITVCTEPTYRVRVRQLDPLDIEIAHRTIDAALGALARCRETGDWSDPEAAIVHTVQIPGRYYGR
jgi:hypothetical protein